MINAITVCVDYADYLKYTLPYNRDKFTNYVIVTTPTDQATIDLANQNNCIVHVTTSFYDNGAIFNKWVALEEGLDVLGRKDDICILDADILIPKAANMAFPKGQLMSPIRFLYEDFSGEVPREKLWTKFPIHPSKDFDGYMQMFNANDPVLGPPPWHQVNWKHAGGADTFFQAKWPEHKKMRAPFRVLHLGPCGNNWCGRVTPHVETRALPYDTTWRKKLIVEMMKKRRENKNYDAEKL